MKSCLYSTALYSRHGMYGLAAALCNVNLIRCWVKDVFELSYLCRVIDSNMSHRDAQLTARCYYIFYSAQLGSESSARAWSGLMHGGLKNLWLIKNGSAFRVVLEIRRLIPALVFPPFLSGFFVIVLFSIHSSFFICSLLPLTSTHHSPLCFALSLNSVRAE